MNKLLTILIIVFAFNCSSQEYIPFTSTGARLRMDSLVRGEVFCEFLMVGTVVQKGVSIITERGFVISIPSVSDRELIDDSTTVGTFIGNASDFPLYTIQSDSTYSVRSYFKDSEGTHYSEALTYTVPEVPYATYEITKIRSGYAYVAGTVIRNGSDSITSVDIEYREDGALIQYGTADLNEAGEYSYKIDGLSSNTEYWVRVSPDAGSCYIPSPDRIYFTTTTTDTEPLVNTHSTLDYGDTWANISAGLVNDGGQLVTNEFFYWGENSPPTASDNVITGLSGTTFFGALTGLSPSTTYYYIGGATNSIGNGLGDEESFTTNRSDTVTLPSVTTDEVLNITDTEATFRGEVTDDGGGSVTRGFVVNNTGFPTLSDMVFTAGSGVGTYGSSAIGLVPDLRTYVRAYATNSAGTVYGNQLDFNTLAYPSAPIYAGNGGLEIESDSDEIVINYPAGVVNGDFLVMIVTKGGTVAGESFTTPSGWTRVANAYGNATLSFGMFVKYASLSEPSSVTIDAVDGVYSDNPLSGIMYSYEDVLNYKDVINTGVSAATYVSSTPTIASGERMIVFHVFASDFDVTLGGGFTLNSNKSSSSGLGVRYVSRSASGGTYNYNWQSYSTELNYVGLGITLE